MDADALSRSQAKAIDEKLAVLTPTNTDEPCIFKVHEQLLKVNEKAYKPMLLAIGPYNDHHKVGQGIMEKHKLLYLKRMLERRNESSVAYIRELRKLEERARNCYAERISMTTYDFVEMMLLDGCFIIEFFLKYVMWTSPRDEYDPIFQTSWMRNALVRDLLLCENQLPYFVLAKLFEISTQTPLPNQSGHSGEQIDDIEQKYEISSHESSTSTDQVMRLHDIAIPVFSCCQFLSRLNVKDPSHCLTEKSKSPLLERFINFRHKMKPENEEVRRKLRNADFKHLLDMMHTIIVHSVLDTKLNHAKESQEVGVNLLKVEIFKRLFGLMLSVVSPLVAKMEKMKKGGKQKSTPKYGFRLKAIPNATKLQEGGIKFKKAKEDATFAMNFSNGVLEIPYLSIYDDTETFLRNLIAYEQYSPNMISNYVTDYVCFMDYLIDSPKDVELLRQEGIIDNWLGDDEVVSTMINKLGHQVAISDDSTYSQTYTAINKHCRIPSNQWMAKLWLEYFNSPWSLLSFMAAVVLLGLSITQTIFAILSYKK